MQTEPNAKQQIVEKIKNSTNILVTVGSNPSVDALSAALSLTLMLNRLDKHATAVFSGQVPPAITFLEPDKTFENSVDSLRDFIIALDKEKADRLRYKVEDEVVRIFITPYKTILTDKDLKFSQGDFNVELIIALGVERREDLDAAITAHGRILHDATVMTINAEGGKSTLGSVDWSDASASSLCEMLMSLSEALQSGLLDEQIATAVLTGIVAATDRFRNEHTSPRVMTMAAQLMAAGANQQLIAAKLEEGHELPEPVPATIADQPDGTIPLVNDKSQKVKTNKKEATQADGALEIAHTPKPDSRAEPTPDPAAAALKEAEDELAKSLQSSAPAVPTLSVDDLQKDLADAVAEVNQAATSDLSATPPIEEQARNPVEELPQSPVKEKPQVIKKDHRSWRSDADLTQPTFGGTLNATVGEAEKTSREEAHNGENAQLLHHDAPSVEVEAVAAPTPETPEETVSEQPEPAVFEMPALTPGATLESTADDALSFEAAPVPSSPTLADIDSQTRGKAADEARAAIDAVLNATPFNPAGKPAESTGAIPALELHHNEPTVDVGPPPVQPEVPQPVAPVDETLLVPTGMPSMAPPLPPLPDFSTLPQFPIDEPLEPIGPVPSQVSPLETDIVMPSTPQNDPTQFRLPGQ